jgi:hypothetical protein
MNLLPKPGKKKVVLESISPQEAEDELEVARIGKYELTEK